jgi:AraC-like DNA-binding protein
VPTVRVAFAWRIAAELSGDPLFGLHAGEHAELGSYDILDYLFLTSATLGDACLALERYHRIVTETWRIDLLVEGGVARFRHAVQADYVEPLWHAWDYFFSGALRRIRGALPPGIDPIEVHLMHAAPPDVREYERVFRCPVRFERPIGELVFDARLLEVRLLSSNPTLHRLVRRHAETLLPVLLKDPQLSVGNLAEQLGVGERSLQRKLAEHGITYKDLVQRVREDHALRALESGRQSIQELAYTLGFNSTAAFSRAFRRWRGMSPSEWQQANTRRVQSTE